MKKLLAVLILCLFLTHGTSYSNAKASTIDTVIAKLRDKVSQEITYKFGTVEEVTIVPDQKAVLLKCSDNPESVKEILIGAISKSIYIYCIRTSGSVAGGGSSLERTKGSFRQVGTSVAIGMWESNNNKIKVRFQLTDEDNAIARSYKELEKRGRFSRRNINWRVLLNDPELIFPRLTPEQRVEAFTRLWSMVKFNFANFDLVPELNWDEVLSEYLPRVIADQPNSEYSLLLTECVAKLKDGHTNITMKFFEIFDQAQPALVLRPIAGKAIITEVGNSKNITKANLKVGDEILKIDGKNIKEVLEKKIYPYIFASTYQRRDKKAFKYLLRGSHNSEVNLRIKNIEGKQHDILITRNLDWGKDMPRKNHIAFEYKDLGDGLAYVAINTFGNSNVVEEFNENFEKINRAKGLIIDVRKNGGGNSSNGNAIISCLIDKAIPETAWKTPQYIASFQAWGRPKKWFEGEPDMIQPRQGERYLGPVVVLIGSGTNSAAEDFVVPLHAAGRATVVGQKSSGSTGQPLNFSFLYGKIFGRVCTKRDTYPDGREFVGVGIIPDIEINPAPTDIAAGRDVVLEKAIEILKSKQM